MGEFAEAIEDAHAANAAEAASSAPATDAQPTSTDASPVPGQAPSSPETPARSAPAPSQAGAPAQKMVNLGALHEARNQVRQLRERYNWLPEDRHEQLRSFWQAYGRDPVGTILGELDSLASQPESRQRILQALGGLMAPQGRTAEDDEEPKPDYRLPNGELFMSERRRAEWRAWEQRRQERQLNERLQPFNDYMQKQQTNEVIQGARQQATQTARQLFSEMKQYPHFESNREAIREKFAELSEHMDGRSALYKAYTDVLHETVLPGLSRQERQNVAADLQKRAGASTPNPARPTAAGGTKAPDDFREAALRLLGHRAS